MIKLIVDKLARITKNRKKLESALQVKIENRGKEIYIEGTPIKEFTAEKIITALDFGFPYSDALELTGEDIIFEVINIKDYTKSKNLSRVRARIIGAKGKTLKTISDLTKCAIEIKENKVGVIGDSEFIKNATDAITSLAKGTKQGNVYAYLEKHQPKEVFDLGLKEALSGIEL